MSRSTANAGAKAPVRIVHLGLGAFHRAHQAWYTDDVDRGREWGIAAFTGRSPEAARVLAEQDGLYTLIERSDDGDSHKVIESIVETHDGADLEALCRLVAAETTAIITITVTEAAYHVGPDGILDTSTEPVAEDLKLLKDSRHDGGGSVRAASCPVSTMPARLLLGLQARKAASGGPIAVVSCDNLSGNGTVARAAVLGFADEVDGDLADWIRTQVSFVETSIDRITPQTTAEDIAELEQKQGIADHAPVVTEPFSSWVLSGDFPAMRPPWEEAGAIFVDQLQPFEDRKLWLLNGAHSLLAYAGSLRGHATVAQALQDTACAEWMEQFWDEAQQHLIAEGLDVPGYRAALFNRFGNSRIEHRLAQIATDGSSKLRLRAVPVMRAERHAGRSGAASARLISHWIDYLQSGNASRDSADTVIRGILAADVSSRTRSLVQLLDEDLADDAGAVQLIESLRPKFERVT
ncbi:mannitol dehydrogenase family protein [Arthrobacter sp. H14]|uniref:mannitol dehydrogenase family protein n=1 Tax=Arthrobacter sp. H14 TaxID=1312959 RepID=UPI0020A625DA|nr:mannitol dehydrogenase family protein [Arthrobacter sp. H14]